MAAIAKEGPAGKPAVLYEKLDGKKVRCLACSHYCVIPEGKSGICGIRQNSGGRLWLLVYGKASAVNLDPIEKKPLFHFLPGTQIFSLGTVGCNFGCEFCQNWDLSQASKSARENALKEGKESGLAEKISDYGRELMPEEIVRHCVESGIPSIAFTYNEPVIFFEYAFDTMKLAKKSKIRTVFVSNGYESGESLRKMRNCLDAINIDLKSMNPQFYLKTCRARLEPVLENIRRMHEAGIWVELTTLIIPNENDSAEELKKAAEFIASIDRSIPWHLTAFHPDYKMRDREATKTKKLFEAHKIAKDAGIEFAYTGNVSDSERQSTYCPKCSSLLVKRNWSHSEVVGMEKGKCADCGNGIPGVWE